jgi:hypothetical protein
VTTREGIISFFAPDARIEPRPGGAFQVYFNPLGEPGMKGADNMRFMRCSGRRCRSTGTRRRRSPTSGRSERSS